MSKGKFALGAVFGAIVGGIAALLTAPKSGKETRQDIKNKVDEIKSETAKKAETVKKQAKDVSGDIKDQADTLKKRAENAVKGAREGFQKEVK